MKYSGALTPLRRWVSEARLAANKSSLRWTAAHSWHRQSIHAQTLPTSWMPCTVSPSAEWPISSCSRQACALRHHDINKLHVFYWQTKHSDIITSLGQTAIYSWTLAQYSIQPKLTQFLTSQFSYKWPFCLRKIFFFHWEMFTIFVHHLTEKDEEMSYIITHASCKRQNSTRS